MLSATFACVVSAAVRSAVAASAFKTNGELSPGARVVRAGKERWQRLEHRGSGEIERSLASWPALGDVLHQFRRAMNRLPMNASLIGNDGIGLDVWQGGEDKLQQMHGRGIVSVMDHGWSDIGEEFLFDGKLVEPGEKSECLLIGHAGDKFAQRLCGQTKGLHLVAGGFKFALCHAQDNESIGNLLFVCALATVSYTHLRAHE